MFETQIRLNIEWKRRGSGVPAFLEVLLFFQCKYLEWRFLVVWLRIITASDRIHLKSLSLFMSNAAQVLAAKGSIT